MNPLMATYPLYMTKRIYHEDVHQVTPPSPMRKHILLVFDSQHFAEPACNNQNFIPLLYQLMIFKGMRLKRDKKERK